MVTKENHFLSLLLVILGFTFFCLPSTVFANNTQDSTIFYIVRHAETETTINGEVSLSQTGDQRTQDLMQALEATPINAIYTSQAVCDKETVKNVAKDKRLFINTYDSQNIESFLERILKQRKGQQVLLVGNLETITKLLQNLSSSFSPASIEEKDYNTLFEVMIPSDNNIQITRIQYSQLNAIIGPGNNLTADSQITPPIKDSIKPTGIFATTVSNKSTTKTNEITAPTPTKEVVKTKEIKDEVRSIAPSKTVEENKLPPLGKSYNINKKGVMLLGYDLVAYFKSNKAIKGTEKYTHTYRDATFHFSSRKNLNTFVDNPEKYLPKYGGWCALGMSIDGIKDGYTADKYAADPENFKIIGEELYVFYKTLDYDSLQKWNEETDEAACIARADKFWEQAKVKE
ncbi:MAG: YHS domain-containing (seleno)protein [Chitinophagales bacterium]